MRTQAENEAFDKGYNAFQRRVGDAVIATLPYEEGSPLWCAWIDGYRKAGFDEFCGLTDEQIARGPKATDAKKGGMA